MVDLIGKIVEVGTGETTYMGKLVEINDDEVYLECESGWIVVPIDRVAYIREKDGETGYIEEKQWPEEGL